MKSKHHDKMIAVCNIDHASRRARFTCEIIKLRRTLDVLDELVNGMRPIDPKVADTLREEVAGVLLRLQDLAQIRRILLDAAQGDIATDANLSPETSVTPARNRDGGDPSDGATVRLTPVREVSARPRDAVADHRL